MSGAAAVPALSIPERRAQKPVFARALYPSLRGKRIVVTGGGSGIGAALVEAFARQGSAVSFLDNSVEPSRALERSLAALDFAPRFYACDLRDPGGRAHGPADAALAHSR